MDARTIKIEKVQWEVNAAYCYNTYVGTQTDENESEELLADATYGQYFTAQNALQHNLYKEDAEIEVEEGYYLCTQNRGYTDYVKVADEETLVCTLLRNALHVFASAQQA